MTAKETAVTTSQMISDTWCIAKAGTMQACNMMCIKQPTLTFICRALQLTMTLCKHVECSSFACLASFPHGAAYRTLSKSQVGCS